MKFGPPEEKIKPPHKQDTIVVQRPKIYSSNISEEYLTALLDREHERYYLKSKYETKLPEIY